jgi:membrane fusion protein, heavy metal efflux system
MKHRKIHHRAKAITLQRLLRQWKLSVLVGTVLLGIVVISRVFAHGGEDHGEATATTKNTISTGAELSVAKEQQFALGMLTELAAARDLQQSVAVTGRVVPRTDAIAEVVAPVGGRVVGGNLPKLGDQVSRGQMLFRVAQVLAPSERASLQVEQARTRAELTAAEREVARLEKLEGIVAGKQLIEARIRRDGARDVLNAISAQLAGSGGTVAVTAPISGEIISAEIASGEVVDGSKVVYRIADLSKVWIEADLFERDIPAAQGAERAEVRTPSYPDKIFNARLYNIGGTVDPATRTIKGLFVVDNSGRSLKLNMSASVGVVTGTRNDVLSIPRAALIESGTRRVVFVHTTPEHFAVRDVVLGQASTGDYVEVTSGLSNGDRVLVTGTHQLRSVAGL